MSELIRTLSIIAAALLLAIAAFLVGRDAPEVTADAEVGKMFIEVENPLSVKGLKIIKFDSSTSETDEFEVAQADGLWRIPSHQDYPADAEQHLVDAATSVMNVEILDAVSDDKGAHEEYGVLDPTEVEDLEGASGVGDRITLIGDQEEPLAEFVVGYQVQDQPGQRYVRRAGLDQVYVVKLDPSRLSTEFSDWIEEDLLQLDPFDINEITFDNYTVHRGVDRLGRPSAMKVPDAEIVVSYDSVEDQWKLDAMQETTEPGRPESPLKAVSIGENEQLNTANLNTLRSALDDLEIVDVERKPAGLQGNSLEDFVTKHKGAFESLFNRGFSARFNPQKKAIEVISDEGDVRVGMKDGVQYVLRFGDVAGGEQREKQDADQPDDPTAETASTSDVLRYLWVTAEVNEDLIPKPELLPLPEEKPTESDPPTDKPQDEDKPDETETPGEPKETPQGAPEEAAPEEKAPETKPAVDETPAEQSAEATPEQPAEGAQGAEGEPGEPGTDGDAAAAEPAGDAAVTEGAVTPGEPPAETPADNQPTPESGDVLPSDRSPVTSPELEPEDRSPQISREKIEAENNRRMDEYKTQLAEANQRVAELNEKFADWYFVISNDVYEQIHLDREQIIEPKPAPETPEGGPAAEKQPPTPGSLEEFNQLKELPRE